MKRVYIASITLLLILFSSHSVFAKLTSSIEVAIPDYKVSSIGKLNFVEIPSGEILLTEEGRPRVPYYIKSINYPKGIKIQNVILKDRTNLNTTKGLKLTLIRPNPLYKSPIKEIKEGWYPLENYQWKVWENPNGSTTLSIFIYPFYYNTKTTEVKFYKNYRFDIEYILSKVSITSLHTDKEIYEPGGNIILSARLNNSGDAQDIFLTLEIKQYASDEIVDGLPVRSLKSITGKVSYKSEWNSRGMKPGHYYAEATLTDKSGNLLDKKTVGFTIYTTEGHSKQPRISSKPD